MQDEKALPPTNPGSTGANPDSIGVDPVQSQVRLGQSWVAQHEARDSFGKFTPTPSAPPTPPKPSDDDPIFEAKINNPFSKFFSWIKSFLKRNQNITIKIPLIGVLAVLSSYSLGVGSGYNWGFNNAIAKFFPNTSPIFHRSIFTQGTLEKDNKNQYFLTSEDNSIWNLKFKNSSNLSLLENQLVKVNGNLTQTPNLIENAEVSPISSPAPTTLPSLIPPTTLNSPDSTVSLPSLYPKLTWETTKSKILLFTSGQRRIEQTGVYLESSEVKDYPQDFIDYYNTNLQNLGFKQTLNSAEPSGATFTFAKDESFFTFGVKNIYQGSGETKHLTGYKAFIEHN